MNLRPYQQQALAEIRQYFGNEENPNNDRRFVPLLAGSVPVTTKRVGQRAVRSEVQPLGTVAPGSNKVVSTASTAHRPLALALGTGRTVSDKPQEQYLPLDTPGLQTLREVRQGAAWNTPAQGDYSAIERRALAHMRTCLVCGAPESQACGC